MLGKIVLENFAGLTTLPQKAASAWSSLSSLVGASYKALLFYGTQQVNGVNYFFIAEQVLVTNPPVRRLVKLVIHEQNGEYKLVDVEEI